MDYSPSPRPTFDGPAHIPYASVTRHLWGDATSGEVADWIYVSSSRIHQLVFGLPPGGLFRHSEQFRTVFAADEVLVVLDGLMIIANPETGEVHRVERGEAAFFRKDTWHHVINHSDRELRVLEMFAPPPASGASGAYARSRPFLEESRYDRPALKGRWPMAAQEERATETIRVLRPADVLWSLQGSQQEALIGTLVSTEQLAVSVVELLPGGSTDPTVHAGDGSVYVLEGRPNVEVLDAVGPRWSELDPRDGFFLPMGTTYRFRNFSDAPVKIVLAVAPGL
jgi:quercetin dioxygenase-like cupin family protein